MRMRRAAHCEPERQCGRALAAQQVIVPQGRQRRCSAAYKVDAGGGGLATAVGLDDGALDRRHFRARQNISASSPRFGSIPAFGMSKMAPWMPRTLPSERRYCALPSWSPILM